MDHNSTAGFEIIAEARQNLLSFGRKEMEDPETEDWEVRGSHVVAPVGLKKLSGGVQLLKHLTPSVHTTVHAHCITLALAVLLVGSSNVGSGPLSCV